MKIQAIDNYECTNRYGGYQIELNDNTKIILGMDDSQHCCENYGYFFSNDNLEFFIGAEVLDVLVVDEQLITIPIKEYQGDAIFVNVETDRGTLQFTAYNEHNGYYGHEVVVEFKGTRKEMYV